MLEGSLSLPGLETIHAEFALSCEASTARKRNWSMDESARIASRLTSVFPGVDECRGKKNFFGTDVPVIAAGTGASAPAGVV